MRQRSMVIICVLCVWLFTLTGYTEVEEKNQPVQAESIDQLIDLIKSALHEKDTKRLEQIKSMNIALVQDNQLFTMQRCLKFLKEFVSNELSGNIAESKNYLWIAQVLAEIYKHAATSNYLLDMVSIFSDWGRKEKEKYLEAEKIIAQGIDEYKKYNYEKSVVLFNQSLSLYKEIGYKEGEANSLLFLGNIHKMQSEYREAISKYEEGLVIYQEIKSLLGEANCMRNLGDIHRLLSEYKKARDRYDQSLMIYQILKHRLGIANCILFLGKIHLILSENEISRQRFEESLLIYRQINDRLGEANCLLNLGDVYMALLDIKQSQQRYQEALMIYSEIQDTLGESNIIQRLGDIHMILSEYEKARQKYEDVLVIFRKLKSRAGEASTLRCLGDIYVFLSEYQKAHQKYEEGLVIFREIKNLAGEANCLLCLGNLHIKLSEYAKARQRFEEGLRIYREKKDRIGESNSSKFLGDVCFLLTEYEKARQTYNRGLAISREIKNRLGEANCLSRLGAVLRMLSKFKTAHRYYKEALSIYKGIGIRNEMIWCYNGLGQICEYLKDYIASQKNYINSINVIEDVLEEMKREEFKSHYFSSNINPYENLISLLFKQGNGASAFPYAERSKARSFLYLLGNKRIDPRSGISPDLAKQEIELKQKINALSMRILENEKREADQRATTEEWNEQLLQLKQNHSEVLEKIKLSSPEYASMLTVNPLSIDEIQSLIREDGNTVLIEYYTTPDNLFMWLLDGKKILPYRINVSQKTLDAKIQEFNSMISNNNVGITTISTRAQRLYNLLLKPVEKYLDGKSRIALVPHGSLHYLPFEALMNNGKFLVEKNIKIFYLPSASVYKYCKEKKQHRKEKATAFVNPDGTLPCSEKEAEDLKQLFPGNVAVFSGKDVTESLVKANSGSSDILHFACHGKFESEHPMYSALLFGPDTENDGRLEISEIFQLQLKPAYLVTLSACETNVGNISPGDEIVGLTRAFIYAGTPSILASLWKVDDQNTEKLMASFYRALRNTDKIDALYAARLEMMNEPGKRHPFYWAAFVLIGDYR